MDGLDRRILAALQGDGRQTNARLAETLGMSQSATHDRVRRLEREGMIRGYRAVVAPEGMDVGLQAFVAAELHAHSHAHIEDFERGIVRVPGVRACYHITGRFDYLVHVAVRDLGRLRTLIKTDIASIPGVAKLETLLVLTEVKADAGWPTEDEEQERP